MKHVLLLFSFVCAFLASSVGAAVSPAIEIHIELKDDVSVPNSIVTLADVASVRAGDARTVQALNALRLIHAPMVGYIERLTREELEQALRTRGGIAPMQIAWNGARAVRIRRAGQVVQADALIEAAKTSLQGMLAARFDDIDMEPAAPVADLAVPAGTVSLSVRPIDGKQAAARVPVWVNIEVDGTVARSAVVPLLVKVRKSVLVAHSDLAAGMDVTAADFDTVQQDIAGLSATPVAADSLSEPVRLGKALGAGKVLTTAHVLERGAVARGDSVTLVYAEGGVVVQTSATAEHDARIGKAVMVRPVGGMDRVEGRLVARGVVEANGTK